MTDQVRRLAEDLSAFNGKTLEQNLATIERAWSMVPLPVRMYGVAVRLPWYKRVLVRLRLGRFVRP